MNDDERLRYLFARYFSGDSTPDENNELSELVNKASVQDLSQLLTSAWENSKTANEIISKDEEEAILQRILTGPVEPALVVDLPTQRRKGWLKYVVAAAVLLLFLGATFYLSLRNPDKPESIVVEKQVNDLAPGQNGAILTLSNGQKIVLDSARNGLLATQGSSNVLHENGEIRYQPNDKISEAGLLNTVTTPKGRQFQLVMSDGSRVWLNAASSITYPAAFDADGRNVSITGEVYFEIAHDENKPFRVRIQGKEEVEVLGTHFNINAYADEPSVNTTLLEGSIRIKSSDGQSRTLKPGQQAQLNQNLEIVDGVNIDEVMAWKNGYFSFDGATTEAIMRQVKRWYDAEVVYEGNVKDERYAGSVPRSENASKLLEVLELTKTVKFTIEGRKIIVTPY